jgi:hypothetical protein
LSGGQTIGDKIFTFTGSSLPDTTYLSVYTLNWVYPPGITISVSVLQSGSLTSVSLDYTLAINSALSPSDVFTDVAIGYPNPIGGSTIVTETIDEIPEFSLQNTTGSPVTAYISGNTNFLAVHETMSGYWGDPLVSRFTDTPEPTTLLLLSLGGVLLRKRK